MKNADTPGWQIAFITFAILLLVVPLSNYLATFQPWSDDQRALIQKTVPFMIAIALLFGIPALRRRCVAELRIPLPPGRKLEVAVVGLAKLSLGMAVTGGLALWYLLSEGNLALE